MSTGKPWTESEIATLKQARADGKSAREIAALLPGRSRNATLGMVHRLRLPQRAIRAARTTYRPPKVARAARPAAPKPASVPKQKSLVLSWKSGPAKPKPNVKIDPTSPAAIAAAELLGRAQEAERRCEYLRARGVNLSW
jgi:hypothetical protein